MGVYDRDCVCPSFVLKCCSVLGFMNDDNKMSEIFPFLVVTCLHRGASLSNLIIKLDNCFWVNLVQLIDGVFQGGMDSRVNDCCSAADSVFFFSWGDVTADA